MAESQEEKEVISEILKKISKYSQESINSQICRASNVKVMILCEIVRKQSEAIEKLNRSMHPHPKDHPAMFEAKTEGVALLELVEKVLSEIVL